MCLRNYIQRVVTSSRRILDTVEALGMVVTGVAVIVVEVIVRVVALVVVAVVV